MESLLSSRYDWIEDALENYRVTLDGHLVTLLDGTSRGAGPAVVWGETQQGKTSLILFLMGVDEKYRERVGTVLRGGRSKGESGTPVPILYSISLTDDWHCSFGDWTFQTASDEDVSRHLATQRREVVDVGISYDIFEPLRIAMPKKFFGSGSNSSLSQALDLPGLNASSKNETEFAKSLDQFLSEATLVLIVHSSKKVMGVFNSTHDLRTLRDWWLLPNKVRLVLTHAYSLENSRQIQPQFALKSAVADLAEAIAEEEQSLTFEDEDELARNLGAMVVPIELGEGLTSIYDASSKSASIETWDADAIELILEARERLVIDVEQSHSIQNEIKSLRMANVIIRRRHEQRIGLASLAIGELEQKRKETSKRLEKTIRDQASCRDDVKHRSAEMLTIRNFAFAVDVNLGLADKTVMDLDGIYRGIKQGWRASFDDFMFSLNRAITNLDSQHWLTQIESDFNKKMNECEATFTKNIFFGMLQGSEKKQAKVLRSEVFQTEYVYRLDVWCGKLNQIIDSTLNNRAFRDDATSGDTLGMQKMRKLNGKSRRLQADLRRIEKDVAKINSQVKSETMSFDTFQERTYRIDSMLFDSFSTAMQKHLTDLDVKQGSVQKYETGLRMLSLIHEARKV